MVTILFHIMLNEIDFKNTYVEAVEASDVINECGTDGNVVVQPQLIVLGVLP